MMLEAGRKFRIGQFCQLPTQPTKISGSFSASAEGLPLKGIEGRVKEWWMIEN